MSKISKSTLMDKVVPIAGSVTQSGHVIKPHYAIRHVKPADAPVAKEVKPSKKAAARAARAVGDLFDNVPPAPEPKVETVTTEKPKRAAAPRKRKEQKPKPEPEQVAPVAPVGIDYSGPFDPAAVPEFGVKPGTTKPERREINAEAAKIIFDNLPIEGNNLSILRQYSGNGGCGDSLNEFYTEPKVAAAMWFVLHKLGLPSGAEVLEPSCATGVFLETAPAGVRVVGVEMDETSSKIGKALHPTHEVQNASLERFATQDARQFDAVIGNAPFGLRGSLLKDDKPNMKTAEAYFMDTALDKTKAGGVVAMIVPTGIMDNKGTRALRERLLRKGDFLGAVRMPNTAFEHSHTEVTTDVLFFRKRSQDVAGALMTVKQAALQKLGLWDEEYLSGEYFKGRGASNVFGTTVAGWRAEAGIGDDITVEGSMVGVPEAISEFKPELPNREITMGDVEAAIGDDADALARARGAALKKPYEDAKRGDRKIVDGVEYILEGDPLRWHKVDEFLQSEAVTAAQSLGREIEARLEGNVMGGLDSRVRAYVEKYGIPAKNYELKVAAHTDRAIYALIGAVKDDGSLSDLVEGRTAAPVESSFDAAAQSLSLEMGYFSPQQVAGRWGGGDTETALDHLYASPDYALDPVSMQWTSVDNYLSGELWPKLDDVKAAITDEAATAKPEDKAKFERQAALLEETIGPKLLEDVEIRVNSAFIPLPVLAAFFNDDRKKRLEEGWTWIKDQPELSITFDKGVYHLNGWAAQSGLLEKYLNRTGVRKDDLPEIDRLNEDFKEWLCASRFRDEVETLYNRKFRGFRQREFSNKPMDVRGLNADGLKDYQWGGVRWAMDAGKGIIAADVGLGKTARALILNRAMVDAGLAKKPMIVVPKSVLANWVAECERWFPGSSVMTIGENYSRDADGKLRGVADTAAERNRKYHDIRQNDYDFILISQPAWNDLDVDPEVKFNYSNDDFWVQRGDSLKSAGDKRVNKIRESYKQHLAQREFQKRSDAIYFNDLGVDMVIGDEFHAFKNLYAARNRFGQQPKFLGGQGLSNRALDMNYKTRWVRDHNNGRNVFGLTATPTKNSPLEIYSMLAHIAPEAFDRIGVRNSEEFLDRFCEFKTETILNTSGALEEALVTVGFKNLDELREIMRRYIDRKTAEDVGLVLPERDDRMHTVDMSPEQEAVYVELRTMGEQSASKKDATGDAHIFSIMSKMGKASMDLELYDASYRGAKSPKYEAAAKQIAEGARDGGQVVFSDAIQTHEKIVDALVRNGMKREEIGVINSTVAESSAKRQNISDAFNAGKLKVVIGNTATMGEGINLQKATTDIHHMDLPWEPASMQQRNGRGLRQGNINAAVRIHTYLAKGSFDGYRYQCLLAKKNWQDLLWNGGDRVENLAREGNISRDDMLIMLSADPEAARKQMSENRDAAKAKFESQKTTDATTDFNRYQEMKRSFAGLKNKNTSSATRLRVKMDRARISLEENPFFKEKWALDAKKAVLIHPASGMAFEPGRGFEIAAKDGDVEGGGKFVVTGVGRDNVSVRRWGALEHEKLNFTLDALKDGVKAFDYDEKAEQEHVGRALAANAEESLAGVTSPKDLHDIPSSVISANYAAIQSRMKDALLNYKRNAYEQHIGLIGPDGSPVAVRSYDAKGKMDDHDLLVPTPEHREKAMEAYIANERAKKFGMESVQARRGKYEQKFTQQYPGGYGQSSNEWGSIGNNVFGSGFEDEAQKRFEMAQSEATRRAKTSGEAMNAAMPTVEVKYNRVNWPKRSLASLYAAIKRDGKLNEPIESLVPKIGGSGWDKDRPRWPSQLFATGNNMNVGRKPAGRALAELAAHAGHKDLAAAMAAAHTDKEEAARHLLSLGYDRHAHAGLRHMIDKNPDMGARTVGSILPNYDGKHRDSTLSQYADEIEPEEERDAA